MDNISKALAKAKGERQSVRKWVSPEPARTSQSEPVSLSHQEVELDLSQLDRHHIIYDSSVQPQLTDVYRLLRTRVLQMMQSNQWSRLGITSPGPKCGKTLNAINLALAIAREGSYQVSLIDGDLRRPGIARSLGLTVEMGIHDYLAGKCGVEDMLVSPSMFNNLLIAPGRVASGQEPNPELMGSDRMKGLLDALANAEQKRIVIVDLPPALVGDDVIALSPFLDSGLLIVAEGVTDEEELKKTTDLLGGMNLLGTVLNNSSEKQASSYGYY